MIRVVRSPLALENAFKCFSEGFVSPSLNRSSIHVRGVGTPRKARLSHSESIHVGQSFIEVNWFRIVRSGVEVVAPLLNIEYIGMGTCSNLRLGVEDLEVLRIRGWCTLGIWVRRDPLLQLGSPLGSFGLWYDIADH